MLHGFRGAITGRRRRRHIAATQSPATNETEASTSITMPNKTTCDICCEENDIPVVQPCGRCSNSYCKNCITKMFHRAIQERSMMPPTCCSLIPLHAGLPYLSDADSVKYRAKFDEIVMFEEGFYCPNTSCARFISGPRIDAAQASTKGDVLNVSITDTSSRHDSVTSSVAKPAEVECADCGALACTACKRLAHAGSECKRIDESERDLDAQLTSWGYKRCPRCRNGVRRMFGCSHMQCGWCAAHFCWYCLGDITDCENNGCDGEDAEGELGEGEYTDDEAEVQNNGQEHVDEAPDRQLETETAVNGLHDSAPDGVLDTADNRTALHGPIDNELHTVTAPNSTNQGEDVTVEGSRNSHRANILRRAQQLIQRFRGSDTRHSEMALFEERLAPCQTPEIEICFMSRATEDQQTTENDGDTRMGEDATLRPNEPPSGRQDGGVQNLDGRSPGHWMDSGLDFGDEPVSSTNAVNECHHEFVVKATEVTEATPWKHMQCHRCWREVEPNILGREAAADNAGETREHTSGTRNDECHVQADDSCEKNDTGKKALEKGCDRPCKPDSQAAMRCLRCGLIACEKCVGAMKKRARHNA